MKLVQYVLAGSRFMSPWVGLTTCSDIIGGLYPKLALCSLYRNSIFNNRHTSTGKMRGLLLYEYMYAVAPKKLKYQQLSKAWIGSSLSTDDFLLAQLDLRSVESHTLLQNKRLPAGE